MPFINKDAFRSFSTPTPAALGSFCHHCSDWFRFIWENLCTRQSFSAHFGGFSPDLFSRAQFQSSFSNKSRTEVEKSSCRMNWFLRERECDNFSKTQPSRELFIGAGNNSCSRNLANARWAHYKTSFQVLRKQWQEHCAFACESIYNSPQLET